MTRPLKAGGVADRLVKLLQRRKTGAELPISEAAKLLELNGDKPFILAGWSLGGALSYACAIGLRDAGRWQQVVDGLPTYLDAQGLARYFPGGGSGSPTLTAYLLTTAHAAGSEYNRTSRPISVPRKPRPPLIAAEALVVAQKVGLPAGVLLTFWSTSEM